MKVYVTIYLFVSKLSGSYNLVPIVVPFNKSYVWLKIPPSKFDTPNCPAAACTEAYVAPVESEGFKSGQAIPTSWDTSWDRSNMVMKKGLAT